PGSTTTTTPGPTTATIVVTFVNGVAQADVCGFAPGATLSLSLNGGAVFLTQTADANGCLHVTITIINPGSAFRAPVFAVVGLHRLQLASTNSTVNINGVTLAAKPPGQQNDLTITGTGANGALRTVHVLC